MQSFHVVGKVHSVLTSKFFAVSHLITQLLERKQHNLKKH